MIRWIRRSLGWLILGIDRLTRPQPPRRPEAAQAAIDRETESLALYQFQLCPFCIKTRRAMHRLGLNIDLRDAMENTQHRERLRTEGGAIKVPCLAIDEGEQTRWMYESSEIIQYLEQRFAER